MSGPHGTRPRRPGFAADLSTTPNIVTLSRIALIVIAASVLFAGQVRIAIGIAIVAGLTDYLDGWLARRTGQVTRLGEMLDQFCDIFYESFVLFIAVARFHILPLWVLPLYLGREFWVTTIRRFMAGHQVNIPTNLLGKLKTNFVMWGFFPTYVSIIDVLPALEPGLRHLGQLSILLGVGFGYASAWGYTRHLVVAYDRLAAADAGAETSHRTAG
jgi:CDP-diacylglycerol--glycerol-3-phosphate 3-phosphatidyltransferase